MDPRAKAAGRAVLNDLYSRYPHLRAHDQSIESMVAATLELHEVMDHAFASADNGQALVASTSSATLALANLARTPTLTASDETDRSAGVDTSFLG